MEPSLRALLTTVGLAGLLVAPVHAQHWGYSGHEGPEHWGELSDTWGTCSAGRQQSPVDLGDVDGIGLDSLAIDWPVSLVGTVIDNGHTIQVNVEPGASLSIGGQAYNLVQFHFHAESEHTVEGRHAPMEVHFVHADAEGRLAVLGVMVEEGEPLAALDSVWAVNPEPHGTAGGVAASVRLADFLPADRSAWRYAGSLTTPPCSETVTWTVFRHAVAASAEQIGWFEDRHPHSYRPVMPLNRRSVLQVGG